MNLDKSWLNRTAPKLKHLALKGIYYNLLNTSCIFTFNHWNNCSCDQFQGCQLKPLWQSLNGKRNYCYVCRVGVTYNAEKIQNLTKITDIFNNYCEIKKDIQLCIDFDPECNEFWMYHYSQNLVIAVGDILKIILMNLIITFVYKIFEYNKNAIRNQKHFKLISFLI